MYQTDVSFEFGWGTSSHKIVKMPPPRKKSRIGTHHGWCITVHGEEDMILFKEVVELAAVDGVINIAVIGDELTSSAGRHAQAFLNFPKERGIAFGSLKKMLSDAGIESAHIEPKKSNTMDRAGNYCLKEHYEHIAKLFPDKGTVAELYRPDSKPLLVIGWDVENAKPDGTGAGKRTDLENFKCSVLAGECTEYDDALLNHSGLCARAEGFVRQFIGRYAPIVPMSPVEWHAHIQEFGILRWQAWAIEEMANADKAYRHRKVHVVTDCVLNGTGGNSHKSHFCDWYPRLMANLGQKVQVLGPGRLPDMALRLQSDADIIIIDIPASRSEHLQWSFVEQLKNGRVDSPKYHSTTVVMRKKPVRVLILCNHHPDASRRPGYDQESRLDRNGNSMPVEHTLSGDRWVEYEITHVHDVESIPNFMLPAPMNFGAEFSSDMTGDGPERWLFTLNRLAEFVDLWEESCQVWGISDHTHAHPHITKVGHVSEWINCSEDSTHPNAEMLRDIFKADGWNGNGLLEVRITIPCNLVDVSYDNVTLKLQCLKEGMIKFDDPRGFVRMDAAGRCARMWVNSFGKLVNLVALRPVSAFDIIKQCITSYVITRGGHIRWRRLGEAGFMRSGSHNEW